MNQSLDGGMRDSTFLAPVKIFLQSLNILHLIFKITADFSCHRKSPVPLHPSCYARRDTQTQDSHSEHVGPTI